MSLFPSSRMTISDSRPWFIRNVFVCLVLVIYLVYTVYFMEIRFSEDQHERVLTHYERVKILKKIKKLTAKHYLLRMQGQFGTAPF